MQTPRIDPKVHVRELTNDQYAARILAYQEEVQELSLAVQDLKSTKEKIAQEVRDAEKSILSFRSEVVVLRRNDEMLREKILKLNYQKQKAQVERDFIKSEIRDLLKDKEDMITSYDEIVRTQESKMKEARDRIESLLIQEELTKSKVLMVQQEQSDEEQILSDLQKHNKAIESDTAKAKKNMLEVYAHIDRQRAATLRQKEEIQQYAEIIQDFTFQN